jgi:hypothetical protein
MQLFINLVFGLGMALLCAYLARQRNRNPVAWFFLGFFFSFIALIALALLRPLHNIKPVMPSEKGTVIDVTVEEEVPPQIEKWFYMDKEHTQQGPVSVEKLQTLWEERAVLKNTYVWKDGMADWEPIGKAEGLQTKLERP